MLFIPLKPRNPFFRAFSQLLKLRFTAMVTYSFHYYLFSDRFMRGGKESKKLSCSVFVVRQHLLNCPCQVVQIVEWRRSHNTKLYRLRKWLLARTLRFFETCVMETIFEWPSLTNFVVATGTVKFSLLELEGQCEKKKLRDLLKPMRAKLK